LSDDTELFYQMSEFYDPALASGVRWNDPAFGIRWPVDRPIMSERDAAYPDFQP
jgi:dTDP-4-dehydrorhamnose 3,5-epimerase